MLGWFELGEQATSSTASGSPVRFLVGVHGIHDVSAEAKQMYTECYGAMPPDFTALPWVTRPILAILEGKQFAEDEFQWVRDRKEAITQWLTSRPDSESKSWLFAVPNELLDPDPALSQRSCNSIPTRFRIECANRLFKFVFGNLVGPYRPQTNSTRPVVVCAVGVDCFYHTKTQQTEDLAHFFQFHEGLLWFLRPEGLESEEDRVNFIETDISTDFSADGISYAMAPDATVARIFLVKKSLAELFNTRMRVQTWRVAKKGDIRFLQVTPRDDQTPRFIGFYWCKFGSIAELENERRNLEQMKNSFTLAKFLYEVTALEKLQADYTAILLSRHEGTIVDGRHPLELEQWLVERLKKGQSALDSDGAVGQILHQIDRFFACLQMGWETHGPDETSPKFLSADGRRYDRQLAVQRAKVTSTMLVVPVKNVKGGAEGTHKILYIRPRDSGQEVRIGLSNNSNGRFELVTWQCPDWRFRLWKEGIAEGNGVQLSDTVQFDSEPRRSKHLQRAEALAKAEVEVVCEKLKETMSETGCHEFLSQSIDLFPVWSHGDFHPRNVLLVPDESGVIQISDERWTLKVIDVADALPISDTQERTPLVFDFVSFEVDMKAKSLFDSWGKRSQVTPADWKSIVNALKESEAALWSWCQANCSGCDNADWMGADAVDEPWSAPSAAVLNVDSIPSFSIPSFSIVASWRHLCFFRLSQAAARADRGDIPDSNLADWTPMESYAKALFLHNIGYLEHIDPDDGEELSMQQALVCIISAAVAAKYF